MIKSNISNLHTNPLNENSSITDDNEEKANILNQYFSNVFTYEPVGNVPQLNLYVNHEHPNIIFTKQTVLKLLKDLKTGKSPGPDGLHPRFLNELSNELYEPLTMLFVSSMQTNKFLPNGKKQEFRQYIKRKEKLSM